jgi:apolipoprotein D and lipocalin family protein
MKTRHWLLLSALIAAIAVTARAEDKPLETVRRVELPRYLGKWYEIARYPNWFEKKCERDVTAEYALRPDGKISVINSCTKKDGSRTIARGWGKVVDPATSARLKVTFFWPFFGNYWVLELGPNYEYSVVGEPGRKFLWILSRTPQMSDEQYRAITSRLQEKGYDATKLVRVQQQEQ